MWIMALLREFPKIPTFGIKTLLQAKVACKDFFG
jgi:hypothetical protein